MTYRVGRDFYLPYEAANLKKGDTHNLRKCKDGDEPDSPYQDLLLEVVEVREHDYFCKVVEAT